MSLIKSDKIYTPDEYLKEFFDITDANMSPEYNGKPNLRDWLDSDKNTETIWDYPLSDIEERLKDEDEDASPIVLVNFSDCNPRWFEIPVD